MGMDRVEREVDDFIKTHATHVETTNNGHRKVWFGEHVVTIGAPNRGADWRTSRNNLAELRRGHARHEQDLMAVRPKESPEMQPTETPAEMMRRLGVTSRRKRLVIEETSHIVPVDALQALLGLDGTVSLHTLAGEKLEGGGIVMKVTTEKEEEGDL